MTLHAFFLILLNIPALLVEEVTFSNYIQWELFKETFIEETGHLIASILESICDSINVYQLNFIQLFFDPDSNVVMDRVLKYVSAASCSKKVVSDYTGDKMGSTSGTQYYVVFCDISPVVSVLVKTTV